MKNSNKWSFDTCLGEEKRSLTWSLCKYVLSDFKGHGFESTSVSCGFRWRVKKRIGNKNQEAYVALHLALH